MDIDLSSYQDLYNETASEYYAQLEQALGKLSHDGRSQEALTEAHISAHSLKSQSLTMNYQKTGMLAKALENFFAAALSGEKKVDSGNLTKLMAATRKLKESLDSIKTMRQETDVTSETENIASL